MSYRKYLFSSVAAATFFSAPSVFAQDEGNASADEGTREVIVVTARRREEGLQDVPVAVTAMSGDALVSRGISSLTDLKDGAVPGLSLSGLFGTTSAVSLTMRGVASPDPSQGTQEAPIPLYVDGIYYARAQGLGLDLLEPKQIEVLRGPQGQLFGRNAQGGLIHFISKKPTGEFGFTAEAGLGNYDQIKYGVSVNLPEIQNLAVKATYKHSEREGLTKNGPNNLYPGRQRDWGFYDRDGVRVAARWTPAENFTADYSYDWAKAEDSQRYLTHIPLFGAALSAGVTVSGPGTRIIDNAPFAFNENGFETVSKGHTLTLEWAATDNITLKSINGLREVTREGSSSLGDALPAGASDTFGLVYTNSPEDLKSETLSAELQFIGSWERFDLTAGFIYFNEKIDDKRKSVLSGPGFAAGNVFSSSPLAACVGTFPTDVCEVQETRQEAETDSYGVYAQGTYTPPIFDDRLSLTAGLRYSDDSKSGLRTFFGAPDIAGPTTNLLNVPVAFGGFGTGPIPAAFSTTRWDPAGTIAFEVSENVNTYVRWAQAYRAGGVSVRSNAFASYGEEVQKTWEAGLKSTWFDNRLTANLAVYRNNIEGLQIPIQPTPATQPGVTDTLNLAQDTKNAGLELELVASVFEGFTLGVNWAHIFDRIGIRQFDNPLTAGVDPTIFLPLNEPKHTVGINAAYETPEDVLPMGVLRVNMSYAYSSPRYFTPGAFIVSGPTVDLDGIASKSSILDGRIAWAEIPVGGATAELAFWGKNLTDESNQVFHFPGCDFGTGWCTQAEDPRTYGFEVRVKY